tara:strand:- start:4073 stop:4777 length:705 start_codon:yes stop_codon:yes gene_type:complete
MGVISKYSEIDIDGDWFDIEDFAPAAPEKIEEVSIPEALRPNLSAFYFIIYEKMHILCFESYSESKSLSARSVEKYFKESLKEKDLMSEFGFVAADIVQSYNEVERIISLPSLRELKIIIRRPNPDDISGNLAAEIEEILREQNAEEYEEVTRSKDSDGLEPNERTKKLAIIGAENGEVQAKSIVNGVLVPHSTSDKPEKEVDTYNKDSMSTQSMFMKLSERLVGKIENWRVRT